MVAVVIFVVGCMLVMAVSAFTSGHELWGMGVALLALLLFDVLAKPALDGKPWFWEKRRRR